MRKQIGWMLGAALLGGALMPGMAKAAPARGMGALSIEKSLLGIRILQSYRDVLNKYGQPNRIYRMGEVVQFEESLDDKGQPTGGVRSLGQGTATAAFGGGAGPRAGGRMGAMGGGGMMSGAPMGAGGGPPASMRQYMGMMSGGPSGGGAPMGAGGGPPASMRQYMGGMGGYGGAMAARGAGGGSGMMASMSGAGGSNNGDTSTFAGAGGFIWVYFYPKKELMYQFYFNKDGRVEMIRQIGRASAWKTRRNIGLGDTVQRVYGTYGWPSRTDQETDRLSLFYGPLYHAQFTVLNNHVVGITVMLKEDQQVEHLGGNNQLTSFQPGGAGPRAGGRMGAMGGGMVGRGGGGGGAAVRGAKAD